MAEIANSAKVRTVLWFDAGGEEAARYYTSLLPDSRMEHLHHPTPDAPPLVVAFTLCGAPFSIINGGPHFTLNEAVSIQILTDDQSETDRLWDALLAGGGAPGQCGWLKDKWGLSWQVVPRALIQMLEAEDRDAAARVHSAMMGMVKMDIATLRAAFAS